MIDIANCISERDDGRLEQRLHDLLMHLASDREQVGDPVRQAVVYLNVNLKNRAPRIQRLSWVLSLAVGYDPCLAALALRLLNVQDDMSAYAVAYLLAHSPDDLQLHCTLQAKRWWHPEIQYSGESSLIQLANRTAALLASDGLPTEAAELLLTAMAVPRAGMPGDFEAWESAEQFIAHEGTDEQRARLASKQYLSEPAAGLIRTVLRR